MSLAIATNQLPSAWAREDDRDVATAMQLLDEQAERSRG